MATTYTASSMVTTYTDTNGKLINTAIDDVDDIIRNVDPDDTPFTSLLGRDTAGSVLFEWLEDALPNPDKANAKEEGFVFTPDKLSRPKRIGNVLQISFRGFSITGTAQAINQYGIKNERAYQTVKTGKALRIDLESIYVYPQSATMASSGRKTATFPAFLTSATTVGADLTTGNVVSGVNYAANYSDGGDSGYPNSLNLGNMSTAPGSNDFTEDMLKDAMEKMYMSYGRASPILMMSPMLLKKASLFKGLAQAQYDLSKNIKDNAIIGAIHVYVGSYGTVRFVPNRWMPTDYAMLLDPEYLKQTILTGRGYSRVDPGTKGDSMESGILIEHGFKVTNRKTQGLICDIK